MPSIKGLWGVFSLGAKKKLATLNPGLSRDSFAGFGVPHVFFLWVKKQCGSIDKELCSLFLTLIPFFVVRRFFPGGGKMMLGIIPQIPNAWAKSFH